METEDLFMDWSKNIFKTFLPFTAVLKIFTIYLNEGIQTYLRLSYTLCYTLKTDILSSDAQNIKEKMRKSSLNFSTEDVQFLIADSFNLGLKKMKKSFSEIPATKKEISRHISVPILYRPKVPIPSTLLSDK